MNFVPFALYQVIEFNNGIAVQAAGALIPPKAQKLFAGSAPACGEYLVRYLHGRDKGQTAATAHREAAAAAAQKLGLELKEWEG